MLPDTYCGQAAARRYEHLPAQLDRLLTMLGRPVRVHDAATIDYCVERLLETDDGGEDRARSYCRFVVLLIHFIY